MESSSSSTLLILIIHCCSVDQVWGFNLKTAGAQVFSGTSAEEFGYTVQQFSNTQGKWLLVGSPWYGLNNNRPGDVHKCDITKSTCDKLDLQNAVNIPAVQSIKANMSLGLTLTRITKNNGFMTCGPVWAQRCGSLNYVPGVCLEVNSEFYPQTVPSPAIQTCGGLVDLAIVLDGSYSIYPWKDVKAFLKKLLESLDIGPNAVQVSLMQYSNDLAFEFNLNKFQTREEMLKYADNIDQKTGDQTFTFAAIDTARKEAYLPERGGRPGATKVMVVVTDGESHDGDKSKEVIENCEKDKITRFGIAILKPSADIKKFTEEIELIASKPKENFVFNVSDEAGLVNIAQSLGDRIFSIEGTGRGQDFQMEMAQVGFSAHQTMNKDVMMLGAVGAYGWMGTVVHASQKFEIFPKQAFEGILEDKNHSSLLGYSVTTLKELYSEYYVAGAPRSKHTGQVIVYTLNTQRQPKILNSQRGDQIGSYFGSVLCPLDVDHDGVSDLLLVGAPMYMNDKKKETGKVYIFSVSKGMLTKAGFLEGSSPLENARFGMAMVAVPDLNLDGFSDVVVGAPLEDDNRGAIYIYNGDKKSIRKQSSQKILGSKLDSTLKFFGRSLDGSGDLNGDSLPDVSVGGYGKVLQLWSTGIVVVMQKVTLNPDKISIQKMCTSGGRMMPCLTAKVCFTASFRPANPVGSTVIKCVLTLDPERIPSRGQFNNSERVVQKDVTVSSQENCQDHQIYIHDSLDTVNPVALRVNISPKKEDSTPVLDHFSSKEWLFNIPFLKHCGPDDKCVSDLYLTVTRADQEKSSAPFLVIYDSTLSFIVTVKNRKENAYNPRISARFSRNLFYSAVSHTITYTSLTESQVTLHEVGTPVLETGQTITFEITFTFNPKQLQSRAELVFEVQSESAEEYPSDNTVKVSIPLKYSADILLTSDVSPEFWTVDPKKDKVKTIVSSFEDIGPELKYSFKVFGGHFPMGQAQLDVSLPDRTTGGNPLVYITAVTIAPAGTVQCEISSLVDPFGIKKKEHTARFNSETFRGTKRLNCRMSSCQVIRCILTNPIQKIIFVNVTARIWTGTFTSADYESVVLGVKAQIRTDQPDLLTIDLNHLEAEITVSKAGATADVPVSVIVGSSIGGVLLLAALIAVLWKVGFFKRKKPPVDSGDSAEEKVLEDTL